ncbi:MAG TPA: hypothetical protein VFM96_01115 [Gaiellaceae bacterium]|nr:hypothetical protein [Gaiellaceae bacterium]
MWHRITDVFTLGQFTDRYRFFKYEARLGLHHPFLGVGLGGVDLYISKHFNTGSLSTAYGVWIAAFAETGVVGFAALVAIFVVFGVEVVRAARRSRGSPWYPVLVGSYAGILAELAGYVTYGERIGAYVWALMGIGLVALRAVRSSEPAAP